jgi:hypothetical protein
MLENLIIAPPAYPCTWIENAAQKGLFENPKGTVLLLANKSLFQPLEGKRQAPLLEKSIVMREHPKRSINKFRYLLWGWRQSFSSKKTTILQYMDADRGVRSSMEALLALLLFRGHVTIMHPVPDDNEWLSEGDLPIKWSIHDLNMLNFWKYLFRMSSRRLPDGWTILYWSLFVGLLLKSLAVRSRITRPRPERENSGSNVDK